MKRYLLLALTLLIILGAQAQVAIDSLKTDSIKKKKILYHRDYHYLPLTLRYIRLRPVTAGSGTVSFFIEITLNP